MDGDKCDPQILKTREDSEPTHFVADADKSEKDAPIFILDHEFESKNSWVSRTGGESNFSPKDFRPRIEPWLTALCQSEHLSLLVGTGLTRAVYKMATDETLSPMDALDSEKFGNKFGKAIDKEAQRMRGKEAPGREKNIEDQIRAANELLQGLKVQALVDFKLGPLVKELNDHLSAILKNFSEEVLTAEKNILEGSNRNDAFYYLVSFLMSFGSRTGTRDRLHLFTTNYDRLIEAGAEVAGMRLLDRFIGNLAPIFHSSRLDVDLHYNPPGIRGEPRYLEGVARFTKLHGSLDWVDHERSIRRMALPFGATDLSRYRQEWKGKSSDEPQLMIYPNAAKDRQTADYPFVDLFRDFAAATCRPNHTLVTYGYGFGDDHINRVIADMLTIPSTHLVIISYTAPDGYEELGNSAQVSMLTGNHLGDLQSLVDYYLPKPAIDKAMLRMTKLLNDRWGDQTHQTASGAAKNPLSKMFERIGWPKS